LRRLGTDYVDLYQIHRWDYETPVEETMEALHDVVKAGKARYIGASSMFAWQFAKAQHGAERNGWTRFVSMQNHYNLMYREEEREMLPLCADQGVAVLPYSPLARGMLAGNRNRQGERRTVRAGDDPLADERYNADADFDVVDRLAQVAAERGAPPAQVALAWLLSRPGLRNRTSRTRCSRTAKTWIACQGGGGSRDAQAVLRIGGDRLRPLPASPAAAGTGLADPARGAGRPRPGRRDRRRDQGTHRTRGAGDRGRAGRA